MRPPSEADSAGQAPFQAHSANLKDLLEHQLAEMRELEETHLVALNGMLARLPNGAVRFVVADLHEATSAFLQHVEELLVGTARPFALVSSPPAATASPLDTLSDEEECEILREARKINQNQTLHYGMAQSAAEVIAQSEITLSLQAMRSCADALGALLDSVHTAILLRSNLGKDGPSPFDSTLQQQPQIA